MRQSAQSIMSRCPGTPMMIDQNRLLWVFSFLLCFSSECIQKDHEKVIRWIKEDFMESKLLTGLGRNKSCSAFK